MVSLNGDLLIVIGKKVANAFKLLIYINLMKTSTLIRCFDATSECIKMSQMSLFGAQLPRSPEHSAFNFQMAKDFLQIDLLLALNKGKARLDMIEVFGHQIERG